MLLFIEGKIKPIWGDSFKKYDYQQGSYYQPLNSMFVQEDLDEWTNKGYSIENIVGYRHIVDDPPAWINTVLSEIGGSNHTVCFFKMNEGNVIPLHKDVYTFYKKMYNLENSLNVWRTIVFLEGWSPGHLFAIEDTTITHWKAGQYVSWKDDTYHMAANLSSNSRYTLQITYTK